MYSPNSILRLVTICSFLILMSACMKTVPPPNSGGNNPGGIPGGSNGNNPPAITPVGIPVGNLVSQTIGPAGGSLVSDDSVVELKIPAGALSENTDISIQSVTDEAPGGIGLSYQLGPDGTKFSVPVTLIFHYTDDQIGSDPFLLFVAYQDSNNIWMADLKYRDVDTLAKTVSLGILHFSIWTLGESGLSVLHPTLLANEQTDIFAYKVISTNQPDMPNNVPNSDDLPFLPIPGPMQIENDKVTNWAVDGKYGGSSDRGTIAPGNGSLVTYTAPASIPNQKTVRVSVEYNELVSAYNRGVLVFSNQHKTLSTRITLIPSEYKFTVEVSYKDYATIYKGQTYYDHATFDLNIKIKNFREAEATMPYPAVNYPPSVTPQQMRYDFGVGSWDDWTWIPDNIGEINITGLSIFSDNGITYHSDNNSVRILLIHQGCLIPKYDYKDSNGASKQLGGQTMDGIPDSFDIDLTTGKSPTFLPDGHIQVKLTPK